MMRDAGEDSRLQRLRAGQADRARAEALHREDEIGEAVVPGERLAGEAQAARIDRLAGAAMGARNRIGEQAGPAEHRRQLPAGRVGMMVVEAGERRGGEPGVDLAHEGAMAVVEERPGERAAVGSDPDRHP
jgi:hypothetical protein